MGGRDAIQRRDELVPIHLYDACPLADAVQRSFHASLSIANRDLASGPLDYGRLHSSAYARRHDWPCACSGGDLRQHIREVADAQTGLSSEAYCGWRMPRREPLSL